MKKLIIKQPDSSSIISQFIALYETLKQAKDSEKVQFDYSQLRWACPLLVLPISAYIQATQSQIFMNNCDIKSYLDTIGFPAGVDSVSDFERAMQANKSYIPISVLKKDIGAGRERLESMFATILYNQLKTSFTGIRNAIYYPIGELVTNIFEHSHQNTGFLFAQSYPKKDYLDICIVDRGRGLQRSYQEDKNVIFSDEDAISEVMKGHSVKSTVERGYGVWTSKRVVCEGLGGNFILVSGSAALISNRDKDKLVKLPDFYWQGVIIAYRMPKPLADFDISRYVE